ncbi:MAG: hypothetical protein ACKVS7_03520 [Gemmatimonadaceae bacterium]
MPVFVITPHAVRTSATILLLTLAPGLAAAQVQNTARGECTAEPPAAFVGDTVPNLAGMWDFVVDMGNARSTGTIALGRLDADYAGALTPDATNTLAIRRLIVQRDSLRMTVASREGDVLFIGRLLGAGDAMCGVVEYHGGMRYQLTAKRRAKGRTDG